MLLRSVSWSIFALTLSACGGDDDNSDTSSSTGTATDSSTGTATDSATDSSTDAATDSSTGTATDDPTGDAPTGGPDIDDLPPAEEVCAAACAKFESCFGGGGEDPPCEVGCLAGIDFIAMNNPGTDCGDYETGRQHCLSGLTCDELDLYLEHPEGSSYPCDEWNDAEEMCAIE